MSRLLLPLALVCLSLPVVAEEPAAGEDDLKLESSVVTGNRELPKVMSIVPWKKSQPGELTGRPASSLLNEVLSPIDREVFRRQLRYHAQLAEQARAAQEQAAAADNEQ